MNDAERFRRVFDLFERARSVPFHRRAEVIATAEEEDPAVAQEVRRLLGHHESGHDELDEPIISPTSYVRLAAGVPESEAPAPERIGRYRILRKLGQGGMGVVFLAEQEQPRRQVALKVMRHGLLQRQVLRRFELEADVLGRLRHPGIAQIYEAGVHEDDNGKLPFFAMEYIDGPSLTDYVKQHRPRLKVKLRLMCAIADAVHYAHQKGIIHRDLKPGNILIRTDIESSAEHSQDSSAAVPVVPKILDFGIARATDSDLSPTTWLTEEGQLVGTLPYMSPEQVTGRADEVDTRSDVYALGVILYEALTEKLPYDLEGKSIVAAAKTISECEPEQLSRTHGNLRGDLNTIVLKALEKQPDRRYASAGELAADLRRFLEDQPINARPASAVYQLRKFAKRNRGLVVGTLAAVAMLIVGIAGTTWQAISATREKAAAEEEAAFSRQANRFYRRILGSVDATALGKDATMLEAIHYAADLLEKEPPSNPRVEAEIRNAISRALFSLGEYNAANDKLLATTDVDTTSPDWQAAEFRNTRAKLLFKKGEFEKAEQLYRRNLEYFRSRDFPLAAAGAVTKLAEIHNATARFIEAETLAQEAVQRYTTARENNEVSWTAEAECEAINHLSTAFRYQGKYEQSESQLRNGIELARTHAGEHSSLAALMKNSLSVLLSTIEREEEAIVLLRDVLAIQSNRMGERHPEIATIRLNLGSSLRVLGHLDEAEEHLTTALDILKSHHTEDHPAVLAAMSMIGNLLVDQKRYDEAFELSEDVLERKTRVLGRRHLRTTISITHLARAYERRGDYARAGALFQEALDIRREELGATHPRTIAVLEELATSRLTAGDRIGSEPLYQELLEHYETEYGADHPKTVETRTKLQTLKNPADDTEHAAALSSDSHSSADQQSPRFGAAIHSEL